MGLFYIIQTSRTTASTCIDLYIFIDGQKVTIVFWDLGKAWDYFLGLDKKIARYYLYIYAGETYAQKSEGL